MKKAYSFKILFGIVSLLALAILIDGCKHDPDLSGTPLPPDPPDPDICDTLNITFTGSVMPIFQANCLGCHSGSNPYYGLDLTNFDHLAAVVNNGSLIGSVKHAEGFYPMPKAGAKLTDCDIKIIEIWIRDTTFTDPGGGNEHPCDPDTVYFQNEILPLIMSSCATTDCHDKITEEQEIVFTDYASIIEHGEIKPFEPEESKLYEIINKTDPDDRMPPPPADPLNADQKNKIKIWIEQGALNNFCEEDCDTTNVTFSGSVWPTIELNCIGCHSGAEPSGNVLLTDYNAVVVQANNGRLFGAINHENGFAPMPKNAPKLIDCKIDQVKIWIENGTPNN